MTKNLSKISELKIAIDSLDVIGKALQTIAKEGIPVSKIGIPASLVLARKRLAELESEP